MSDARRFAEALGSWMHLEACCFRAGLFSESSFKSAIGSVASSLHANHRAARVHADYPLAAIQRVPDGERNNSGGRKRSVDFAMVYDDGREPASSPEVLIEAKWAGSSHCTVANVVSDFIRLTLMKSAHPGATCLLVLAGHSKDIDAVLSRRPFVGGTRDVIRYTGTGSIKKFTFLPSDVNHQKAFAATIAAFHAANIDVPIGFTVSGSAPYPVPGKFKAVAWEVRGVDERVLCRNEWPAPKKKKVAALSADAIV